MNKMEKIEKKFGDRVRELRKAKGWTLEKLAEHVEVRHSTVANWENTNAEPYPATMNKLAAVLDTTVAYLLHGEIIDPESPMELREAMTHYRSRAENAERELKRIKQVLKSVGTMAEAASEPKGDETELQKIVRVAEEIADDELRKKASSGPGRKRGNESSQPVIGKEIVEGAKAAERIEQEQKKSGGSAHEE